MAVSLKHSKTSVIADNPAAVAAGEVVPSDWNAEHVLTQATARLLGRTTAGTGATEEIAVTTGLSFASGVLKMADMPANTIKGNNTGGSAAPTDLSATQVRAMIEALTTAHNLAGPVGINGADAGSFYAEAVPLAVQKNQNAISTIGFSNSTVGASAGVRTHFVCGTANAWYSNALYDGNGTPYQRSSFGSAVTEAQWMFNSVNKMKLTSVGNLFTGGEAIELGELGSGNRYAYVDFHGDDTYTDYALRIIRNNAGANADSEIIHRGTGTLKISAYDAGQVAIIVNSIERMRFGPSGTWTLSGWGRGALMGQSYVLQWAKGTTYTFGMGQSGDGFYLTRSTAEDNSAAATYVMQVTNAAADAVFYANVTAYSDIRKKKDIESAYLTLDQILTMRPITYTRIENELRGCGAIAQEVEKVLPLTISEDDNGFKSLDYGRAGLIVGLSLAKEVAELRAEVSRLQNDARR